MLNREIYDELKEDFKKKSQLKDKKQFLKYCILLIVLIIPLIVLLLMRPHEYIDNFDNIPEPIQTPASGGTSIIVNGDNVRIDFLAQYELQGRVLAVAQYGDSIFERLLNSYYLEDNIIRYRDVGIGWGYMAHDEYVDRINRRSMGRFLSPEFKTYEDLYYVFDRFGWDEINRQISHNHIIPANNRIKFLLHGIEKGQYIRIKGYLVSLHGDSGYNLRSSLTREDQGDGACETIYVTDVSRLKEKK